MAEVIGASGVRILFQSTYQGPIDPKQQASCSGLAAIFGEMEELGYCPTLDDGLSAGNSARLILEGGSPELWVTASGRVPGSVSENSYVHVSDFDPDAWSLKYKSSDESLRPTSDTPLYWAALIEAPKRFAWSEQPMFALHGHALDTPEAAARIGAPISNQETRFSTPEDREALLHLMQEHPYPDCDLWIRRGHGFFLLASNEIKLRTRLLEIHKLARS